MPCFLLFLERSVASYLSPKKRSKHVDNLRLPDRRVGVRVSFTKKIAATGTASKTRRLFLTRRSMIGSPNQDLGGQALTQAVNQATVGFQRESTPEFPSVLSNMAKNLSWTSEGDSRDEGQVTYQGNSISHRQPTWRFFLSHSPPGPDTVSRTKQYRGVTRSRICTLGLEVSKEWCSLARGDRHCPDEFPTCGGELLTAE